MGAPLLTAAATAAAVATVHLRDPHEAGSYAFCPWLLLTGVACPGCGGLRAVHDLTHGDVAAALSGNLVVVAVLVPAALLLWLGWTRSRWRGRPFTSPLLSRPALWSLPVLLVCFGVARNLPAGAWLAP